MDESKFCTGCGRTLEPGMQFCPQCGKVVSGSEADVNMKEQQEEFVAAMKEGHRMWLVFVLGIFAIPALVAGIFALADAGNLADAVWASAEFQSWIKSHGLNYTLADVKNYVTYAAVLVTASGGCALACMILVYLRKMWLIATILCFAAAILCFWSVFGMLLGFLVGWTVFSSKDLFEDAPAETADAEP